MDVFTPAKRSSVMSRIRSKNTKPELALRSELFRRGLRYRIHKTELPGKPDIVFAKAQVAVQVRGCFWHQHDCTDGRRPKSNSEYWAPKLQATIARDAKNDAALREMDWEVVVVWECELSNRKKLIEAADCVAETLDRQVRRCP